jgi:uncharacterized protein YeaO (DUF488 family)
MAPSSAAAEDKHMNSADRAGLAPRPASQAGVNPARLRAGKDVSLDVRAKWVYDQPERQDGYRVLIDHVWPRGISRERARPDRWARELAPSDALRKWFDHRPSRFADFRAGYRDELAARSELVDDLRRSAASSRVTVLYAARDREHNNAVVLAELLRDG